MGSEENLKVQERMLREGSADGKTCFIATHFVHSFGPFRDQLEAAFEGTGFLVAYDGMEVML